MLENIRVGDIMTRNFIHTKSSENILNCAKIMNKKRVGSIVLKDNENIIGILTERDIIWTISKKKGKDLSKISAGDIAARKIISIRPEATLDEALSKMNRKKVRRLPVMSNKKIVGYITLKDMLKFRPILFESLKEEEKIREESKKIERSQSAMKGEFIEDACEECGNFDILTELDSRMICESCNDSM